jgi:hypothetical protein
LDFAAKLSEKFNVSIHWLLNGEGPMRRDLTIERQLPSANFSLPLAATPEPEETTSLSDEEFLMYVSWGSGLGQDRLTLTPAQWERLCEIHLTRCASASAERDALKREVKRLERELVEKQGKIEQLQEELLRWKSTRIAELLEIHEKELDFVMMKADLAEMRAQIAELKSRGAPEPDASEPARNTG